MRNSHTRHTYRRTREYFKVFMADVLLPTATTMYNLYSSSSARLGSPFPSQSLVPCTRLFTLLMTVLPTTLRSVWSCRRMFFTWRGPRTPCLQRRPFGHCWSASSLHSRRTRPRFLRTTLTAFCTCSGWQCLTPSMTKLARTPR